MVRLAASNQITNANYKTKLLADNGVKDYNTRYDNNISHHNL